LATPKQLSNPQPQPQQQQQQQQQQPQIQRQRVHVPTLVLGFILGCIVTWYCDHVLMPIGMWMMVPDITNHTNIAASSSSSTTKSSSSSRFMLQHELQHNLHQNITCQCPSRQSTTVLTTHDNMNDASRTLDNYDMDHDPGWHLIHVFYGNRSALFSESTTTGDEEALQRKKQQQQQNKYHHQQQQQQEMPHNKNKYHHFHHQQQQQQQQSNKSSSSSVLSLHHPWYAQAYQDEVIIQLLGSHGYFLDLAANDAKIYSNTLALETYYHWQGLCVEPNPIYWYGLSHRKCIVVAALLGGNSINNNNNNNNNVSSSSSSSHPVPVKFRGVYGGIVAKMNNKLADLKKEPDAPTEYRYTIPLRNVLSRFHVPSIIDYLSLDLEGMEYTVMEQFPWEMYHIRVMTVERPRTRLRKLLKDHGYVLVKHLAVHWGETLWVHNSTGWTADSEIITSLPSVID
jgi:FtsZ-interacting cell division protein YlmF